MTCGPILPACAGARGRSLPEPPPPERRSDLIDMCKSSSFPAPSPKFATAVSAPADHPFSPSTAAYPGSSKELQQQHALSAPSAGQERGNARKLPASKGGVQPGGRSPGVPPCQQQGMYSWGFLQVACMLATARPAKRAGETSL